MEKAPLKQIGYRIYERRTSKKYTKQEMAELLNMTPQEYGKLEKGQRMISLEEMLTICRLLQFSPEYFLTGQLGFSECSDVIHHLQNINEDFRNNILYFAKNWNTKK